MGRITLAVIRAWIKNDRRGFCEFQSARKSAKTQWKLASFVGKLKGIGFVKENLFKFSFSDLQKCGSYLISSHLQPIQFNHFLFFFHPDFISNQISKNESKNDSRWKQLRMSKLNPPITHLKFRLSKEHNFQMCDWTSALSIFWSFSDLLFWNQSHEKALKFSRLE
jgi:hypothetical protein